jgi:hypothetical protein
MHSVLHTGYPIGVVEVFNVDAYELGNPDAAVTTCGHCGRSWDDNHVSSWTPTPSARCPFEYDHEYEE